MVLKSLYEKYRTCLHCHSLIIIALYLFMFCLPQTSLAQDIDDPGQIEDTVVIQNDVFLPLKSESRAFNSSLWGTLAPLPTLFFTIPGIIVGPSLGYFYGGMPGRAWTGIGIRVSGVGGMISSFVICGWDCGPGESAYTTAWIVFISSTGLVAFSAIYDIASIKKSIRKKNESILNVNITFAPKYFARTKSVGFELSFRI